MHYSRSSIFLCGIFAFRNATHVLTGSTSHVISNYVPLCKRRVCLVLSGVYQVEEEVSTLTYRKRNAKRWVQNEK